MTPIFTTLTLILLLCAILFENTGLAAAAIICAFGGI